MPSDASERWSELAAQFAVPEFLTDASTFEVAAGQLRQATWAMSDAMVLIDRIDDEAALAHVYPVSVEPGTDGGGVFVIDAVNNPLSTALHVWPKHARWIPFASLDDFLAIIDAVWLKALETAAAGISAPKLASSAASSAPPAIETSSVAELLDAVDSLEGAPRLSGSAVLEANGHLDIDLEVVMRTLGATQSRAMNILSGTEPISAEEADLLSNETGLPTTTILGAVSPLPAELERELQEPRWRRSVRRRAVEGDEESGRLRLGYDVYQLAARQTGAGRELWRQRLDTFLASEAE